MPRGPAGHPDLRDELWLTGILLAALGAIARSVTRWGPPIDKSPSLHAALTRVISAAR